MRPAGVETAALDAENRGDERAPAAPRQHRRDSLLLFVACTLMWTANSMYLINMPLYVVHELRLPERLAGILMGAAAGLEIPIMLLAGLAAKHCGKRRLMRGAVVAGVLFYCGLLFITGSWQLIALQLLNAAFIGVLAGIGMLYFQDLMPGRAGRPPRCSPTPPGWAGSSPAQSPARWRKSGTTMRCFTPRWR